MKRAEQNRPFTISGDQLRYTTPAASGGGTATLVWKRAKWARLESSSLDQTTEEAT
jgi:hypothetical protein